MQRVFRYAPRVAIFLAGIAAGALSGSRRERSGVDSAAVDDLKRSVAGLEDRVAAQESAHATVHQEIEARLDGHDAKLAELPSTEQLTAAVERLLVKTMATLDERLATQAHSIDVLKTTVSQTDTLLERVLESLDALQTAGDAGGLSADVSYQQPAV
jgi:glutamyl-tRNA reductase